MSNNRKPDVEIPLDLPVYPIRTVAKMTGLDARRIRGWDTFHNLLQPARTKGGHRLYSHNDIERIKRIHRLVEGGMSLQGIERVINGKR